MTDFLQPIRSTHYLMFAAWLASVLVIATGFAPHARAEPGPVTNYLMDEPVSLFSFGIWQLHERVSQLGSDRARITASYDWGRDRIIIVGYNIGPASDDPRTDCRDLMSTIRRDANVNPETGKLPDSMTISPYAGYFSKSGRQPAHQPKDLWSQVDAMFFIRVNIIGQDMRRLSCEGPLMSSRVIFIEPK